jgi:hypothetical protein
MPTSRPNGIARVGGKYVVGGIDGLFLGTPGHWTQASTDSIRQIRRIGEDVWVVHGDGALDKLDVNADHLYPDILTGASRRPWTACVAHANNRILCGGMGGWSERPDPPVEHFPSELAKDVVTAIAGRDQIRWVGTEQSGVVRFGPEGRHIWNPGNGLMDTWVTSLCRSKAGLLVGTMHAGLFKIVGDAITAMASPSQRVTQVALWKGALVIGGMDGAWIQNGSAWRLLIAGEEATSIAAVDQKLAISTATGIYLF